MACPCEIDEATQRWDDLIRSLQSIVSLAPSDVETRIKLVKLLALVGRVYQALELINVDNEGDTQNAKLLGLKAAILYKLNDKSAAIQKLKKLSLSILAMRMLWLSLPTNGWRGVISRARCRFLKARRITKHIGSWSSTIKIENIWAVGRIAAIRISVSATG